MILKDHVEILSKQIQKRTTKEIDTRLKPQLRSCRVWRLSLSLLESLSEKRSHQDKPFVIFKSDIISPPGNDKDARFTFCARIFRYKIDQVLSSHLDFEPKDVQKIRRVRFSSF